jgi:gamma-polyglutamate biosynthesis protein CapC
MNRRFFFFLMITTAALVVLAAIPPLTGFLPRLPIFPESGIAKSLYIPVLVGLIVMTLFTETLGWNYSGLVVPGYLTPLLLIKPWSFTLILIEAALSYMIVAGVTRLPAKARYWSAFFGRDRFFLILAVSVGLRIVLEVWVIDAITPFLENLFGGAIDFRSNLYSVGLIVVPLLANMFWNSGFRKGVFPVALSLAVTVFIVKMVIIPYTNYSLSNIEILYEDLALDFMFSSKAYLILLAAAFMASRANLKYGWDFSGILVPSLLALAWLSPFKVAATVFESALILLLARFIVSRRFMMTFTVEGPRKVLLLFLIGFFYKSAIGLVVGTAFPGFKASDLFGFGFLLPSLIAVKMWQKASFSRILGPIIRVSIAGVLVGNLIGFGLYAISRNQVIGELSPRLETIRTRMSVPKEQLLTEIALNKAFVKRGGISGPPARPLPSRARLLETVAADLFALIPDAPPDQVRKTLRKHEAPLLASDFDITRLSENGQVRYVILQNRTANVQALQGWGALCIDLKSTSRLVIEAPYPISEPFSLEAAGFLFSHLNAAALIVAGSDSQGKQVPSADVLQNDNLPFSRWHKVVSEMDVLRVRVDETLEEKRALLAIAETPAPDLDPRILEELIGTIEYEWSATARFESDRSAKSGTRQELMLSSDGADRLLNPVIGSKVHEYVSDDPLAAFLAKGLPDDAGPLAATERLWRIRAPDVREKAYFSLSLLPSILEIAHGEQPASDSHRLRALGAEAKLLGFELARYRCLADGSDYLLLYERESDARLWGTMVFRLGRAVPVVIEVPRPVTEFHTLDVGYWLFDTLLARAMIWPGSKTVAGAAPLSDATGVASRDMPFNLAHQQLQRTPSNGSPGLGAIQVRGFSELEHPDQKKVVVSPGRELSALGQLSEFQIEVVRTLEDFGLTFDYFDGSPRMVDFGVYSNIQKTFSARCCEELFLTLWFPSGVRRPLRHLATPDRVLEICRRSGIELSEGNLAEIFGRDMAVKSGESPTEITDERIERTLDSLIRYRGFRNENYLSEILDDWKAAGFEASCFTDDTRGLVFFLFQGKGVTAAVHPTGLSGEWVEVDLAAPGAGKTVREFRKGKGAVMVVRNSGAQDAQQP